MRKRRHDWPRVLAEHRASGENVKEFCEARGIHPNTFYKKRQLLGNPELVEIPVLGSIDTKPIVVRTGRYRISVQRGFDRECLKSILEVIGELR